MRAKVEWMDVDHAQEPMTTVGTGDGSVAIGILTGLVMTDLGDIIATEHLTGMMTGDIAVEDQQFGAKLRAQYANAAEGAPLTIKVKRGTETVTLSGKVKFAAAGIILEPNPSATPKAVRIREGIVKGTTDK